jgi:hypothetical protein
LSHHRIADFNFAQSIRAGLILPKPNQNGVNFKETEEVAFSLATFPPIGFLEIKFCCPPKRGGTVPLYYIDCCNMNSLPTGIFWENK